MGLQRVGHDSATFSLWMTLKSQERKAMPVPQQSASTSIPNRGSAQASESSVMGPGTWRCCHNPNRVLSFRDVPKCNALCIFSGRGPESTMPSQEPFFLSRKSSLTNIQGIWLILLRMKIKAESRLESKVTLSILRSSSFCIRPEQRSICRGGV